ncbi:MAG: TIGR03087 family PEP-CTERM/XrtA system glycosyltransferase [Pirellulales bacterium]|nr:TIGR03087 family PEP-CTERM/XrtA system glycosyltransferase [Pirellulales bacterium]
MLVHRVPLAPDRGDRIRSYHLLRFLAERADVWLATLADEPCNPQLVAGLEQLCPRLAIVPLSTMRWLRGGVRLARGRSATSGLFESPDLHRTVAQWHRETKFDAVLVFCSSMVAYAPWPRPDCPVVVDLVDVDSQKWSDYAAHARGLTRWLFALESRRLRFLEQSLAQRSSAVALVSQAEAAIYRQIAPTARVIAIPNGVNLDFFNPPAAVNSREIPDSCVFVGALDYRANVDGLTWFVRKVWPSVRAQVPQARLKLVGRSPSPAIERLAQHPGIDVVGTVADVRPYLERAAVAIVPLRIARGIQNKVLEAAAMRKAMIVSPAALEGLAMVADRDVLVASDAQAWCDHLKRLFGDGAERRRLASAARDYVERQHSWTACLQPFAELLQLPGVTSEPLQPRLAEQTSLAETPT